MKYVVKLDEVNAILPPGHVKTKNKVLFDDKENRFAMWMGELAPEGYAEAHRHPFPQAVFVLEGEGEVVIGNDRYAISPRTAYFVPPHVEHQVATRGAIPLKILVFSFNLS